MRRRTAGAIMVVALLAGCGPASEPTASTTSSSEPAPSASPSDAQAASDTPTQESSPSAADDVATFVAAAQAADAALRSAEEATRTLSEEPHFVVDATVNDLVSTAEAAVEGTWSALPPGSPEPLLEAAVRVAGGLEVRLDAMQWFGGRFSSDDAAQSGELTQAVACLDNGTAPATGFADDVSALVTLASTTPPIPTVAPDSAQALRISVIATWLHESNTASYACGGAGSYGEMPAVVWTVAPGQGDPITGTVDDTYFEATVPQDPAHHSIGTDLRITFAAG